MHNPQHNVASVWDNVAKTYEQEQYWAGPENRANLQVLLSHIGDPIGQSVIEVGCGSGFTSVALAKLGARCALLDISPASLEVAKAEFASSGLPEPDCYLEDALDCRVASDSFDVVWNGGVIEHFSDTDKARLISEMLRIARPSGIVLVLVPNAWCWPFQLAQVLLKLRAKWQYGFEDDMSPRRLGKMCRRLGIGDSEVYAFNPILGWRWLKRPGKLVKRLGFDDLDHHLRRSRMGMVSVLAIRKEGK